MPRYAAQRQSLYGNVGMAPPNRPMVDIGGAIQELGQTAGSLIHAHYLREAAKRQQEHEYARQAQEDAYRRQDREDRAQERQDTQSYRNRELQLKALQSGVTLGTEGGATVDEQAPTPTLDAPTPSLRGAMVQGMSGPQGAAAPTSPLTQPVTAGSLGTIPNVSVGEEAPTPASYDPTHDMTLQRQLAVVDERAAKQMPIRAAISASNLAIAKVRAGGTVQAAQIRANAAGRGGSGGNGGLHGEMTANAREQRFEKVDAPGILASAGWDIDAANNALDNTAEGQELKAKGFTARHLAAAWTKHQEALAAAGVKLSPSNPGKGVGRVLGARASVDSAAKAGAAAKTGASAAAPKVKLSSAQKALAKSDPGFAQHLKDSGYAETEWK